MVSTKRPKPLPEFYGYSKLYVLKECFITLSLLTNLNSENNTSKIKPSVIEKISTQTSFGSIFPINLARIIFSIFLTFTKSETTKKNCYIACRSNGLM